MGARVPTHAVGATAAVVDADVSGVKPWLTPNSTAWVRLVTALFLPRAVVVDQRDRERRGPSRVVTVAT